MSDSIDDYEWPICVAPKCKRRLWVNEADRWACRPCQEVTLERLTDLPSLFVRLDTTAALERGARKPGASTSGSKVPPIPPRLEVLALIGPGGIAARLRDIEDAWRNTLGWTLAPWRGSPAEAIPEHARFLVHNLPWACEMHESVGQDIEELRRLHTECTAAISGERRPGKVQIGLCPAQLEEGPCGAELTATTANHRIQCGTCDTRWEGLHEWRALRLAQEAALELAATAAMEPAA